MVRFIVADYLVALAALFSLGAHWTTRFLMAYYTNPGGVAVAIEDVIAVQEANPIMRYVLLLTNANQILQVVIVPAYFLVVWVSYRVFFKPAPVVLFSVALMIVLVFFMDFTNNMASVLGVLARNGWFQS